MIKLTPRAAAQINKSAEAGDMTQLALRVAARKTEDGAIEYGLGFDEVQSDDKRFESEGIYIVVAKESQSLLDGAVIDFDAIDGAEPHFIFMNPRDPNYVPPTEGDIDIIPPKSSKH